MYTGLRYPSAAMVAHLSVPGYLVVATTTNTVKSRVNYEIVCEKLIPRAMDEEKWKKKIQQQQQQLKDTMRGTETGCDRVHVGWASGGGGGVASAAAGRERAKQAAILRQVVHRTAEGDQTTLFIHATTASNSLLFFADTLAAEARAPWALDHHRYAAHFVVHANRTYELRCAIDAVRSACPLESVGHIPWDYMYDTVEAAWEGSLFDWWYRAFEWYDLGQCLTMDSALRKAACVVIKQHQNPLPHLLGFDVGGDCGDGGGSANDDQIVVDDMLFLLDEDCEERQKQEDEKVEKRTAKKKALKAWSKNKTNQGKKNKGYRYAHQIYPVVRIKQPEH